MKGKQTKEKTGKNPLLEELNDDGPTLADIRQNQLNEQKKRNDAEFQDVDPATRIHIQGYEGGEGGAVGSKKL